MEEALLLVRNALAGKVKGDDALIALTQTQTLLREYNAVEQETCGLGLGAGRRCLRPLGHAQNDPTSRHSSEPNLNGLWDYPDKETP
jgi:hypothetical protein